MPIISIEEEVVYEYEQGLQVAKDTLFVRTRCARRVVLGSKCWYLASWQF